MTGNSETATTVGGVPAWNWTASSVAGNTWIFVPETLQNHTTYTGNITVEGSGQIYLDFFNGAQDFESPTITLSNTSQTLSLTVTTNLGTPEFQLRTPTTEALDVTATDAEIVNDTPTRTAQPIADTDELATLDDVNGNPTNLGDGGPATSATLNQPSAVATDGHGDVYIADTENNLVREVTPDGTIRTVAGTGQPGDTGDGGPATDAELNNPSGVAVNAAGDLFIADSQNNVIREVTPTGTISTVAGHPTSGPLAGEGGPFNATTGLGGGGFGGDGGPATDSLLESPEGLAVDSAGDLFIADTGNSAIREIDTSGTITTVAGQGDDFADTGDGGPATQAALDAPYDVAVDAAGDLYIADTLNNAVREVTSTGTITTLAGGNGQGNNGLGGTASQAQLDTPESVAVDSTTGDVYVSSLAGIVDDISGLPATATGPTPALGETPLTVVLPLAGVAAVAPIVVRRRRRLIGRTA